MRTIKQADIDGKKVIVRCDFNVPLREDGGIDDDFRIQKTLPTLKYLLENNASLVLVSHLGKPGGKVVDSLSLRVVKERLEELLGVSIQLCGLKEAHEASKNLRSGEILMLENIRFYDGETHHDEGLAKELSLLGDVYCNDAFSVCHRDHASVTGIPKVMPSYAGLLLEKEVAMLSELMESPRHPVTAIIGGTKVESKLPALRSLLSTADQVIMGHVLDREAKEQNISFTHPEKIVVPIDGNPDQETALDLGSESIEMFKEKIQGSATVFWAGPLGKYEDERYAQGSIRLVEALAESDAHVVLGGGNMVAFLGMYGLRDSFDNISTGGSAMLQFLARDELPGLKALK